MELVKARNKIQVRVPLFYRVLQYRLEGPRLWRTCRTFYFSGRGDRARAHGQHGMPTS
jgi:hypothetical protein